MRGSLPSSPNQSSSSPEGHAGTSMAVTNSAEQQELRHGQDGANWERGDLLHVGTQFENGNLSQEEATQQAQSRPTPLLTERQDGHEIGTAQSFDRGMEQRSATELGDAVSAISHLQLDDAKGAELWGTGGDDPSVKNDAAKQVD
ncbi:hypothetical protein PMZ80_006873 [Knufia obscura]|uniref:Uncharacterized protein n=1 Tax=Knufia obscura TaxID=1635080 RepID=A0ABR0RJL7_9EURO|nr:hypothetical protein PMZ80_006873 [Knufia obscura]